MASKTVGSTKRIIGTLSLTFLELVREVTAEGSNSTVRSDPIVSSNFTVSSNFQPSSTALKVIAGTTFAAGIVCCLATFWCIRNHCKNKESNPVTYPSVQPSYL